MLTLLLSTLVVCYLAVCVILFLVQRSLVFPAPTELFSAKGLQRVDVPGATSLCMALSTK